jgi:hypothetical protein
VNKENQLWLWFGSVERHLQQNITAKKLSKKKRCILCLNYVLMYKQKKFPI